MTKKQAISQIAEEVTKEIIASLEGGVAPWVKPWNTGTSYSFPINGSTLKAYNGINWISLILTAGKRGFSSNQWFTFKQAKAAGGAVVKGSKGTKILFCQPITIEDEETEEERTYIKGRCYTVFAREQIEGLPEAETYEHVTDDVIEGFIKNTSAKVEIGGGRAYYSPKDDYIRLPKLSAFKNRNEYYATAIHELVHWSGGEKRLNRDCSNYAFEELVAELGAAFLCSRFQINGNLQHTSYIKSWIQHLNEDYTFITQAASQAQKAVNYLLETKH
ncbi:MAG: zincin-like metallopeptidase domain-containing protein [Proteobacteria bacterium]|nr:zincin-like metallopeptidase domain-containing protein [Pseudomonadota bacterium]